MRKKEALAKLKRSETLRENDREYIVQQTQNIIYQKKLLEKKWNKFWADCDWFQEKFMRYKMISIRQSSDGIWTIKTMNMKTSKVRAFKALKGHSKYEKQEGQYVDEQLLKDNLI